MLGPSIQSWENTMRLQPIITTVFGVAIAAGSVFVAKDRLLTSAGTANAMPSDEFVEVIVARADINFGQAIESHLVSKQSWPREALPIGAFTDYEKLIPANGANLRRTKGRIFAGEIILASKVSGYGDKVTLVQKLGENARAMSIKVDAVTAVGGFVTPGDFVDIVMTQGSSKDMRAVTILQNIRVIGVDQQSEELKDQPEIARTITVEVTPDQGQRLALAQKAGSLSLTLRTLDGVEDKPMDMVSLQDLLQSESPVAETAKRPTITVRRGTSSEEVLIKRSAPDPVAQPVATPIVQPVLKPLVKPRPNPLVKPIKTSQVPAQEGT
jgi:pilus assembly protein CpaB